MNKYNKTLNIFVFNEKDVYIPENSFLVKEKNDLTNIKLNSNFLKNQYWVFKNVNCEFYGFCDGNKYFAFNDIKQFKYDCKSDGVFKELGFDDKIFDKVKSMDIVLPKMTKVKDVNNKSITIRNWYKENKFFEIDDLNNLEEIIKELSPQFLPYFNKIIDGNLLYQKNMMIMKKESFIKYCEWAFPILFKFDQQKNYTLASITEMKSSEFIAEILLTVFVEFITSIQKNVKVKELSVAEFLDSKNPYLMPKFDNKIGICFASDDNYARHLGVALTSLVNKSNSYKYYDIIIFNNNISLHNINLLETIVKNNTNISLRFICTSSYVAGLDLYERDYCNVSTYLRFAIIDLLKNFKRVIYLDGDIIINHDIADLYDIDIGNNYVAAARDVPMASVVNLHNEFGQTRKKYIQNRLHIDNIYDYFCAGVMMFNVEVMKDKITTQQLFDIALKERFMYQDQDVLNMICYKNVYFLDIVWDFFAFDDIHKELMQIYSAPEYIYKQYYEAKKNPYIIHYAGQMQPMFMKSVNYSEIYWQVARISPFYEELLLDMYKHHFGVGTSFCKKINIKRKIKNKLSYIFPKHSKIGKFLRRLYKRFINKT